MMHHVPSRRGVYDRSEQDGRGQLILLLDDLPENIYISDQTVPVIA